MTTYDFDEWVEIATGRIPQPSSDYLVITFPTESIRTKYLQEASSRSDEEVRGLLRTFLGDSRTIADHDRLHLLTLQLREESRLVNEAAEEWTPRFTEYERRLITWAAGSSTLPTWEGCTWVLDLLPHWPQAAIDVIHTYTLAHAQVLPDLRLSGLADSAAIIRSRYILQGSASVESLTELLLSLQARDFEFLTAALFRKQGYEVEVTPFQKDGGKDVIARKDNETIFVECKNWRGRVNSDVIVGLIGRVEIARATRGIVVGTSGFTSGHASATEVAKSTSARIALWGGEELIRLMNQNLGSVWHLRLENLINGERREQSLRYPVLPPN